MQDLNEYLPPITMQWCHNTLQAGQFLLPITAGAANDEGDRTHYQAYEYLRKAVQHHVMHKQLPHLQLSNKPTGAYTWQPTELVAEGVCDMQFENEGLDTLIQEKDYEDIRVPSKLFSYIFKNILSTCLLHSVEKQANLIHNILE